ncbi:MAG: hypothetical protein GWN58_07965, partial [Anaerolineae bacterium]|nr:hypothetical protein [Anaerolineae bacterium]
AAQAQEALLNANVRAGLLREEDVSMARRMLADATETAVKPDAKLFDQIYTSVIDDLNPLRMATRALGFTKDRVLAAAKDPYVLARLARGATGRVQARVRELHQALAEFDPGVQTIGSARRILGGGKHHRFSEGFLGDLRDYLVSGRTLELELRGIKSGADAEGLALAKKTFDEAPPHIKAAAQKMYDWQNANLKRLKDAGFLDDASFKNIMEMNRMYVPFKRAFSAEEQAAMRTSKGAGTVLKSIRGSERQIVDPFETIMENAYVIEQ